MLRNTGERLILEDSWNLMTTMEHLHRYHAAAELIKGKTVLDAACGTGYGSLILSKFAESVTGIDLSGDAVEYAREHYKNTNLTYKQMSITNLEMEDHSLDAIISFETIEHVTKDCQLDFLKQVVKKLKSNGIFVVSTPNDQLLRDISYGNYRNEFHLCEMNEEEFVCLLQEYFPYIKLFYQTVTEASSIVAKGKKESTGKIFSMEEDHSMGRYYIAVCSFRPIDQMDLNSCLLPKPQEYFDERYFMGRSRIYLDMGEGYTGDDFVEAKYISKDGRRFDVNFSLEEYSEKDVKAMRFDPCEHGCKICLEKIGCEGENIALEPVNVSEREDGWDVFWTMDPIYEIQAQNLNAIRSIHISGIIDEIPDWKVLARQETQKEDLERTVADKEQEQVISQEKIHSLTNQLAYEKQSFVDQLAYEKQSFADQLAFEKQSFADQLAYEKQSFADQLAFEKEGLENQLEQEKQSLKQKDDDIKCLTGKVSEAEEEIKRLREENDLIKNGYRSIQEECGELRVNQENLERENQELRVQSETAVARYLGIENSTVWKLSKPLRITADKVKGIFFHKKKDECVTISAPEKPEPIQAESGVVLPEHKPALPEPEISEDLIWRWDVQKEAPEAPLVSVIVPNYNHEPYLRERLDSIYNQTYQNFEVILLDDCSKDESRKILDEYAEAYPDRTQRIFNTENCGKVFRQWDKGISAAKGELIWIAESDDYCERNFLEKMVPLFCRESVTLAFARSVFMQDGRKVWSTEEYLSDLPELKWNKPFTMTAHNLVNVGFGMKNVIPNVSSAVFRNIGKFTEEEHPLWEQMKLCGDWVFYLNLIKGGCVSYTNETTNYYRVHAQSTSLNVQRTSDYYREQCEVSKYVVRNYKVDLSIFETVLSNLKEHYKAMQHTADGECVEEYYKLEEIRRESEKRRPNVLMCLYSMSLGGGETYALHLANEMKRQNMAVTLVDFRMGEYHKHIRDLLHLSVPCVEVEKLDYLYWVIQQLGGEIAHSHHACVDEALANWIYDTGLSCRQVITLHGMYETLLPDGRERVINTVMRTCKRFIYIADKNLAPFREMGYYEKDKFVKLPNGLPEFDIQPVDRKKLHINDDDFVLCLASRGIPEKGWKEAVEAVKLANERSNRKIHLVILGDGEVRQRLEENAPEFVHFTGMVSNVREYFAMSDMGLLPSRFKGESYPLVIIECFFVGKPMIATDVGEVKNQLMDENGDMAGELLSLKDWTVNIDELCEKILRFANNQEAYEIVKKRVPSAAKKFQIEEIVRRYCKEYQDIS